MFLRLFMWDSLRRRKQRFWEKKMYCKLVQPNTHTHSHVKNVTLEHIFSNIWLFCFCATGSGSYVSVASTCSLTDLMRLIRVAWFRKKLLRLNWFAIVYSTVQLYNDHLPVGLSISVWDQKGRFEHWNFQRNLHDEWH